MARIYTEKQKEDRREANRKFRAKPGIRERLNEYARLRMAEPEVKERNLAHRRKRMADPEIRERYRETARKRLAKPGVKERLAEEQLARYYGLKPGEWEEIFETQGRRCAICRTDAPMNRKGWHTDHCHVTGKVRGILCQPCNIGLGGFKDNPEGLRAAADYLEMAKGNMLRLVQRQFTSSPGKT